jgi:hypothetical protein
MRIAKLLASAEYGLFHYVAGPASAGCGLYHEWGLFHDVLGLASAECGLFPWCSGTHKRGMLTVQWCIGTHKYGMLLFHDVAGPTSAECGLLRYVAWPTSTECGLFHDVAGSKSTNTDCSMMQRDPEVRIRTVPWCSGTHMYRMRIVHDVAGPKSAECG